MIEEEPRPVDEDVAARIRIAKEAAKLLRGIPKSACEILETWDARDRAHLGRIIVLGLQEPAPDGEDHVHQERRIELGPLVRVHLQVLVELPLGDHVVVREAVLERESEQPRFQVRGQVGRTGRVDGIARRGGRDRSAREGVGAEGLQSCGGHDGLQGGGKGIVDAVRGSRDEHGAVTRSGTLRGRRGGKEKPTRVWFVRERCFLSPASNPKLQLT